MQGVRRRCGQVMRLLDAVSGILLLICTATASMNAIARYVFSMPFRWGEEASVLTLVWMVYLSQGMLESGNAQLSMTALYRVVGRRMQAVINVLRSAVTVAIGLWLLLPAVGIVKRNYELGVTTQAMGFPFWAAYLSLVVGLVCIIVARVLDPLALGADEGRREGEPAQ